MLLWTYLVYALVAIGLTVWLATTLFRNGAVFLEEVFTDNPAMAAAVNHLLVVGFYMLNLGWAFLILRSERPADTVAAVETLASKLGLLLVTLGLIHFANLYVFQRVRRGRRGETIPPVQPTMVPVGAYPQAAWSGQPGQPAQPAQATPPWTGQTWDGRGQEAPR
ncbi:hypothetical protein BH23ACT9_BH23ACT9_07380 [soil metagenome]